MADALLAIPVALDLQPLVIEPPTAVTVCIFIEAVTLKCLVRHRSLFYRKPPQVPFGPGVKLNLLTELFYVPALPLSK
jgi:hypothetical protein